MRICRTLFGVCFFSSLPLVAHAQSLTPAGTLTPGSGIATFLATPIAGIPAAWLQSGVAVTNLGFTPATNARLIIAGTGLTGGGDLTADRTLSLAAGAAAANLGFAPVPDTRSILAGTGLTGGGNLTTDRTLSLASGAAVANLGFTPVPNTRTVTGTGMLAGGGDLTANRTITMATAPANTLVGNPTGSTAVPTTITLGTNLSFSGGVLNATGGGGTPGGSSGQIQYNNAGAFGGATLGSGLSFSGGVLMPTTTVNPQSGTTYTVVSGDANKLIRTSNASAVTLSTTATAATLGSGFGFSLECDGAGGCTFDPTGAETINGATSLAIPQHSSAWIQTDGTVWRAAVSPHLASVVSMAPVGWIAGAVPGTMTVFTATQETTVISITGTVETAVGGTATIAFWKAPSGTACASGTNQISAAGTFNANGTANANQTLTLAGGAANILASGDRICAVAAGAGWTSSHTGSGAVTVKVRI